MTDAAIAPEYCPGCGSKLEADNVGTHCPEHGLIIVTTTRLRGAHK